MRAALVCGSLLAAMAVFAAFPLLALDLPLHIAMGELILDRAALPPTNVVLHTQENTPCVNDKWLHQVAGALAGRACLLDPWEPRTFRVSAMAYRRQEKPDMESRALRAAALLEDPAPC